MSRAKNSGYYVEFKIGEETKLGMVRYEDQHENFSKYGKVFVRIIDKNFKPVIKDGKKTVTLIHYQKLKLKGYFD